MTSDPEQDFLTQAEACMQRLLATLDGFDPDELEADASAGVIKMTFADGRVCVLNRQSAAHQIWLAEGASAWHFAQDPESGEWLDTKGRGSLRKVLSGVISDRLGRSVAL